MPMARSSCSQADTTVVALDAKTGKVDWSMVNGDPKKGETATATVLPVKDNILVGISGGEFGVRCHITAYNIKTGKMAWRAYSEGPDNEILVDPVNTTELGKPIGTEFQLENLEGRPVETGRRLHLGLVFLRSRPQSGLLRQRQPLDLEPETASGRQQIVDDHLRPQSRYRRWPNGSIR